jgi:hypothetical protein
MCYRDGIIRHTSPVSRQFSPRERTIFCFQGVSCVPVLYHDVFSCSSVSLNRVPVLARVRQYSPIRDTLNDARVHL